MSENKLDLIFKAYDVRGVFNETITPKVGFKIGAAFASYVDSNEIIVGHDGRISNNEMFAAISSGIQSVNKKVLYIGMVPTDVVYTISGIKNLPGLIITASHNPKEYTGLKFCNSGAVAIGQETGLKEIKNLAENFNDDFITSDLPEMQTLNELYLEHFKNIVDPSEISDKVKFAIDGGNGVLGAIIEDLSKSFSLNFEGLYMEVDGNFPNHPADPSNQDNLLDLKNKVLSQNFDFGVAFDGDADRSVFIDDKGNIISGSLMTCLISDWLFEKKPEIKIVHNVNVQPSVIEYLKNKGIETIRSKVGHSYIKKIMRDNDADFGGEHSAHFYLRENFYADSGILTLLIFLKILSEKNIKSSALVENYNFKPSSGEINYIVEDVETSLKKIENSFEGEFDKLDGISYFSDDFWFNLRGSNTEPMLRLNAEAINQKTLDNIIEKISNIIS
ncbi:phosphomannomutase/phosphoglucomutase [Acidimicrobiaceae bacterium]|nr:phosphomannomutase/phosphoglucomutase [Acidimicrobiaceae bacterium]